MKKQTKLLAILLTLVMLIGVFAIGASAYGFNYTAAQAEKITGESFVSYSNFNNSTVKEYVGTGTNKTGSFTKQNANAGQTLGFQADDDATQIYIVQSEKDGTDRYIQIKNETAAAATSSFYLKLATGVGNTSPLSTDDAKDAFLNSGNTLKDIKYYVLDFDVFFPTGELSIAPTFGFYFRGYGSDGARGDLRYNASKKLGYYGSQYLIKFTDAGDDIVVQSTNSYASNGSYGYSEGTALSKDEWSHISIIVESVPVTKGSTPALDIKCYTVLNGEIIYVHTFEAPAESYAQNWMNGDMTGVFVQQLQFNIPKIGVGDVVNIDNVALRAYDRTTYTDTLAANLGTAGTDITGWDRDSYDADLMPFGNAVASVGETEYDSIAKAVKAADEGATIEMIKSTDVNVVIDKPLTINLNGKTVTGVSAAAGFEIIEGDGTITVQKVKLPTVAKIGDTEYSSLADAVAAAQDGATITLYANTTETLEIGKPLTIVYNSFTAANVTAANGYFPSMLNTSTQLTVKPISDANFLITKTDGTTYYSDDTFYNVLKAIKNAPRKEVKLLKDVNHSATGYIEVYRTFTLDLNGHTLNITESVTSSTKAEFLFNNKNITFTVTGGEGKVGTINVTNDLYHVFKTNPNSTTITGVKLILKNLNVTSGSLIQNSKNSGFTVNVENSVFNLNKSNLDALVEASAETTFNATNCKFYAAADCLIYSTTAASVFNFTGCDIYREGVENGVRSSIFASINDLTKVNFNECNIVGSLTPATAENIYLGAGTTLSADSSYNATTPAGYSIIADGVSTHTFSIAGIDDIEYIIGYVVMEYTAAQIGEVKYDTLAEAIEAAGKSDIIALMANITESITIGKEITIDYNGFTLTGYTIAPEYCKSVTSTAEQLVIKEAVYKVTKNDGTVTYSDGDLYSVLNNASAKSVIMLLQDANYSSTTEIKVYRTCTLDLNGYTLNITQGVTSGTKAEFAIEPTSASSSTFTITGGEGKQGTINITNSSVNYVIKTKKAGVTVILENLNITSGALIQNTYANFTVGIENVNFNLTKSGQSALIDTRNTSTVTANNSKFYLQTNTLLLSQAVAGATESTFRSTFDFTNCDIYRDAMDGEERRNLFACINAYTYVTFTGCNIAGSMEPATNVADSVTNKIPAMTAANVILGKGTTLSADSAYVATPAQDCSLVDDTGEYTFTILGVSITYAKGTVVDYRLVTIKWYYEDGKTIFTTTEVALNKVGIEAPEFTPGSSNGWFTTTFDGWTTVFGSTNKVDLATYVVEGEVSFYPAIKSDTPPTAHLKNGEYNLTLTGNITINFYLPEIPEGITITGVFMADGESEIVGKNVILSNGDFRTMYVVDTVGATALTESVVIKVKFTVTQNGTEYPLTQTIALSPYKYAVSILKSDAHSPETHTLIADMVRYSNTLAIATKGASVTELDDLLDQYGEYCSELPTDNDFAEYTTSVNNLKGYIETISFEVSEYQPRWRFTFTEAMKVVDVKITLDGYFELPDENGYNFGSLTYNLNTTDSSYSGNYLTVAYIENIPMYNVDKVITITVTTEDGEVREGTYSLNVYYANMGQGSDLTKEELSKYRDFLKTFRAFGITSAGYRYPEGMKKAGAATVEFINCDHPNVTNRSMNATNNNNGILCPDCQTYVFFYEVYIKNNIRNTYASIQEAFDNNYNAYTQIYLCHSKANTRAAAGYKVGCYAGNYNFYLGTAQLSSNIGTISVKTDTNWNGAYFLVDDSIFNVSDLSYEKPLFNIQGLNTTIDGTTYQNGGGVDITDQLVANLNAVSGKRIINANAKNIGWSNGMPMMIELLDYSQTRYHREGANASKAATHEVILIDEFGNVNPTTPIEWDYIYKPNWNQVTPGSAGTDNEVIAECSFKAVAYPISTAPITISGLDANGNINCTFETKPNQTNIDMTSFNACMRGIQISTSNVTIQGLEHIMNEDPNLPRQTYKGFIIVTFANNTTVKDIIVDQHSPQTTTDGTYMGSYELNASDSINTSWINCRSSAFFDANGNVSTTGMFGTNRIRNSYLKNCVLISFDAHTAAYNVTIEDSTFAHINLIGAGDIVLNNVVVYADASYSGIILRRDYGSRWEGNVYVDGLELRHSNAYDKDYVDLVRAQYTNHDFGFQDQTATSGNYLPEEVHAKNVTITQYTRTTQAYTCTAPGIVDEVTTASDKPLGILAWYSESLFEYYPTFSWNDDNNQTVTKAFYIEGGCVDSLSDLYLPKHSKLKNIVIEINGNKQTWA